MVAIITGKGTGLERSSAFVLGSRGQLGSAALGRDGEGVFVNAASGNLVITRQDEFLLGLGPDISINRTYNSQATLSDGDNDDKWRMSPYRKIVGSNGAATLLRIDWDGSETTYTQVSANNYVCKEGPGPYDALVYSGGSNPWTWTDGTTQVKETYDGAGKLISTFDTDGNTVTYLYNGSNLITQVMATRSDGVQERTNFVYDDVSHPTWLQRVETYTNGAGSPSLTRVFYEYDSVGRLSVVKVNLDAADNSKTAGGNYVSTYTYDPADSTNKRVASITQLDGSSVAFTYALVGGEYKVASYTQTVAAGVTRTTSFDYTTPGRTTITDPAGQKTILWYNGNNELMQISYPPEGANVTPKVVQFLYNSNGDVISATLGPGNVLTYLYDSSGNLTMERDSAGNTISRTYDVKNALLTETKYLVPDPDGAGAGLPASSLTTRYAYDVENHLRYVVSAEGFVTQYEYDAQGRRTAANEYAGNAYNIAGLADTATIAEGTLTSWVTALDKTTARRTETTYDPRAGIATVKSYSKMLANGLFDTSSELSQTTYVYDQAGNLLSRVISGSAASEVFVYDGLNRMTQATDFNNAVTRSYFLDALGQTVITHANGLSEVATYNKAGELITTATSNAGGNLVDLTGWPGNPANVPSGQATVPGWMNAIQHTDETQWASTTGPDGLPVVAIRSGQLDASLEGGGNHTNEIQIDGSKAYEFTFYFKLSDLDKHYIFFGLSGAAPAMVENLHDGADNGNPYFWYAYPGMQDAYLDADKWYKVVGYVLPQGTATSSTQLGGVYDVATGQKVLDNHLTFRWNPERTGTTVHARFFNYYGETNQQYSTYFYQPEVRQVTAPGATSQDTAISLYRYDALGRLRMTIDPTGQRNYMLYDSIGRKVADVDSDGSIVEYRYDGSDNITSTTRYATKLTPSQLLSLANFDAGGGAPVTGPSGSTLLTNGSFDTSGAYTTLATGRSNTDLPGWTKTNAETFEQVSAGQMGVTGTDGAYWLDLESVAGTGYVPTGSNLLTNGSFDTSGAYTTIGTGRSNTTLTGWTKTNAETFEQVTSGQMGVTATDGAFWFDMESVAGTGAYIPTGSNLVLNPSFETSAAGYTTLSWGRSSSTLPNWTKTNAEVFEQVSSSAFGVNASNGSFWLDLDSVPTGTVPITGNLLVNGSFDTSGTYTSLSTGRSNTDLPGWTKTNSHPFEQVTSGQMGVTATNGAYWFDMDSVTGGTNPNLIVNGSFELSAATYTVTGTGRLNDAGMNIPGWVKTNALGFEQLNSGVGGTNATDGAFYLDMESTGGAGSNMDISQTITGMTAGAHTLKFDYANFGGYVGEDPSAALEVSWNGNIIAYVGSFGTTMVTKTYTVTALAGSNTLRLREIGERDGIGCAIDNVRLTSNASSTGGNMDISQTVSGLTAGQTMQIQFDHANRTTAASGSFEVYWNGNIIATINSTGTAMLTKSYYVVAQGGANTLRFKATGTVDALGASIDNVRLYAVEPTGGGNMDISQTIAGLTAGQIMQLQFDHANRTTGASGSFEVYWNGTLVATINSTGTTMLTKTYNVTALGGNNVLRFKGTGTADSSGASIDNVRLYATQLDVGGGNMDISQTVAGLTAGQIMQLQFDHANRTTAASGSFEVYWNGGLVATINSTGTTMLSKTYQVAAIAGNNVLRFKGTGTVDAAGASIDNVRLFATTTPVGGGNMDISQTVGGLAAGQLMQVQFNHANRTGGASGNFEVYWNNSLIATVSDTGSAMQTKTYNVTAVAGNNTIRFKAIGTVDASGASIDNVRLFATSTVAAPASLGVALASIRPLANANDVWAFQVYDAAQRLIQTIDGTGATTVHTYDGASRLTSTTSYANRIDAGTIGTLKALASNSNRWILDANGLPLNRYNLSVAGAGTIDGANAYQITVGAGTDWQAIWADGLSASPGQTVSATISVKAVGSVTMETFGNYGAVSGWGADPDAYATIVSGPGQLTYQYGGLFQVSGLSTTEATRITVTRTYRISEWGASYFYLGSAAVVPGQSTIIAAPVYSSASSTPLLPTADATNDRVARNFYDNDGRLTGTLDGEGYLTQILYDKGGEKTKTIAYSGATSAGLRAAGTFAQLLGSVTIDNAKDIHNYFVYDARGMLRATVDGEGALSRFSYFPSGDVAQVITGQTIDPATLLATPPTFANLPAAPGGTILQTISYTRNLYGKALTETVTLTGATTTTTTNSYDVMGRLVSTTTQSGGADPRTGTWRYDLRGRLTGEMAGIGNASLPGGASQAQIDAAYANYGVTYAYDNADRMISSIDPNGNRTLYYYDADGRVVFQVDALGEVAELRYNALGQRTDTILYAAKIGSATLPGMTGGNASAAIVSMMGTLANASLDDVRHLDFNVDGTVSQAIDPLGTVTTYSYNAFGELIAENDPLDAGRTIQLTRGYDRRGLLKNEVINGTFTTSYGYDAFGRAITLTNALGKVSSTTYDRKGRLRTETRSPDGSVFYTTIYSYDARDNLVAVTDALGKISRFVYDKANRKIATIDALGGVATTTYDADGRVLSTRAYFNMVNPAGLPLEVSEAALALPGTNAADQVTRYSYDKDGRLRFAIDGLMHVVENVYDDAGNLIRTVAYDGTIAADGSGAYSEAWIAAQVAPLAAASGTRVTRSVYDAANRLNYAIDALGQVTGFTYDSKGQMIRQVEYAPAYATGGDPSFSAMNSWRDANASANDRTTRAYYDRKGQLSFSIDALGFVGRLEYDKLGNVTKQWRFAEVYSATDTTALSDLVAAFASPLSTARATQFGYDAAGRLEQTTDAEGYITKLTLDALGQIISSTAAFGVSGVASTTAYAYDDIGRMTKETRGSGTAETSSTWFFYDAIGRQTASVDGDNYLIVNGYDAIGNQLTATRYANAITGSFTTASTVAQLQALAGTSAADAGSAAGYDAFGRVTSTTDARGSVTSRGYDVIDRLLSETQLLESGSGDDLTTSFTYDNFGNVVKVRDARGNDSFSYFDRLGRVFRQVDAEKFVTDTTYSRGSQVATIKRWANRAADPISEASVPANPAADPLHDAVTTFTLNRRDEVTAMQDAEGFTESYVLNAFGERTTVTSKLGAATNYVFDKRGLMLSETLPITTKNAGGATIAVVNKYEYDARGNRTRLIEAFDAVEVRTTNYGYDKLDRLTTTTRDAVTIVNDDMTSSANVTPLETIKYDRRGNVIETIVELGATDARTLAWYDGLGRRIAEASPVGTVTRWTYDANGNVASTRTFATPIALPGDATGPAPTPAGEYRETIFAYDRADRLTSATVANLLTGEWNGTGYAFTTGNVVSSREYDKAGNVIHQEDGRGSDVYSWYDKLGREIAKVDAENYLTTWSRDADGNVLAETRYATQLGSFTPGAAPPTVAANAADRTTNFVYDRNGRRTQEQRLAVAYTAINGGTGAATDYLATDVSAKSTISYTYNGLGEVLTKTEANTDVTSYTYDAVGRLTLQAGQSFTDYQGASATPRVAYVYDGLNNLKSSRVQMAAVANDTNDRITTYTYGAGGRLATMTDATGFTHSYGYDLAGRTVRDSYIRVKSDGTTSINEAQVTRYDLAGRVIIQTSARYNGSTWLFTDTAGAAYDAARMRYNAFGEVTGRGLTAGPNAAEAYQETFDFDGGGRLWKSTSDDGVLRFHVYDKASNETLTLASTGADLSGLTLLNYTGSIIGSGDTSTLDAVTTITVYDKRGQATATREPDRQITSTTTAEILRARTYNAFGDVTSETDARGAVTNFTYNTMGNLLSKVSPQVSVTEENGAVLNATPTETYGYDLAGRMVSIVDANGFRTTRSLLAGTGFGDSEASVLKEFHPDAGMFERKYDVFGAMRVSVNEIGKTETFLYDKMNRLIEQGHAVRPAGSAGNSTGAAIQLIDQYVYDGLGRRIQHWNSLYGSTVKETTDYDAQGRVEKMVDLGGSTTTTAYAWSATLATSGLGTFGGWIKTIVGADGHSQTESVDYFGRTVDRVDAGGHDYNMVFDKGGRLISQAIVGAATTGMTWFNTGFLATQSANGLTATYGYDENGRRTRESYGAYQNAIVTWDAMGRMTTYSDTGAVGGTAPATIAYQYDRAGNVRHMAATYSNLDSQGDIFGTGYAQDYWYKYDNMNRFTTTMGVFTGTPGSGAIYGGMQISYDASGNRATVTMTAARTKLLHKYVPSLGPPTPRYYDDNANPITPDDGGGTWSDVNFPFFSGQVETYTYTADGYLAAVSVAVADLLPTGDLGKTNPPVGPIGPSVSRGAYEIDAMGRVTSYSEYDPAGLTVYSRIASYDVKSQLTSDTVTSKVPNSTGGNDTIVATTTYYYTTGGGLYLGGAVDRNVTSNTKNGSLQSTVTTTNGYVWWDGPRQTSSTVATDYVTGTDTNYTSTYSYDGLGHLSSVYIGDGRARTVTFVANIDGKVLQRDENDNLSTGDPRELHYYFNGIQLGDVSNNGTSDVDYVTGIARHTAAPGTGPFQGGSATATNYVDFDQSYDPINGLTYNSAAAHYTTSQGDTLQAVALAMWGDASLWYLIANANGLTGSETLAAGITLSIPNRITNTHNSADTFRVYDPNKALGDLSPTAPKPPKAAKGCGVIGLILLVAIAVAVTIVTSGAAVAALAPGGMSIGTGIGVIMGTAAASSAAAGVGLGTMIAAGAIGGAVGSIVSQGIGVATGLQEKFSWKGVAMGAISGAIGAGLGKFSALSNLGPAGQAAKITGTLGKIGQFLGKGNFISGAVRGVITSAATQGIGVATGLQDKFSWAGVAAAGIGGGVSSAIGARLEGWNRYGAQLVSGAAGAIANAATRTLIEGSDFGDNILASLPDVIGSTLGNLIAGGLAASGAPASPPPAPAAPGEESGEIVVTGGGRLRLEGIQLPDTLDLTPINLTFTVDADGHRQYRVLNGGGSSGQSAGSSNGTDPLLGFDNSGNRVFFLGHDPYFQTIMGIGGTTSNLQAYERYAGRNVIGLADSTEAELSVLYHGNGANYATEHDNIANFLGTQGLRLFSYGEQGYPHLGALGQEFLARARAHAGLAAEDRRNNPPESAAISGSANVAPSFSLGNIPMFYGVSFNQLRRGGDWLSTNLSNGLNWAENGYFRNREMQDRFDPNGRFARMPGDAGAAFLFRLARLVPGAINLVNHPAQTGSDLFWGAARAVDGALSDDRPAWQVAQEGYRRLRSSSSIDISRGVGEGGADLLTIVAPELRALRGSSAARVLGAGEETLVRGGSGPVSQGAAGVDYVVANLEAAGGRVLGREITIEVGGIRTRPDLYVELPNGTRAFLEVKTGPSAGLTPNQKAGFPVIRREGGIPRGANAQRAGLTPGTPISATPVWELYNPWPLP